jgi:predicted nucleic acid-binding protein
MTMLVEPGIADTNVLIYALDTAAPQHAAARALLDAARTDTTTLFVTSQILCEFYSVMTNPRRIARPRDAAEALTALSEMLAFLHVLPIPASTIEPKPAKRATLSRNRREAANIR